MEKIKKIKTIHPDPPPSSACRLLFPADDDASNVQIMCAWCQKVGVKRYSLSMGSELKSFCSEKCFAACRRAYFKRNKVTLLFLLLFLLPLLLFLLGSSADTVPFIGREGTGAGLGSPGNGLRLVAEGGKL